MPRNSQAEVFIKTLADVLQEDRERRSLRLQRQVRDHAERYITAFRTDVDGSLQPSADALRSRQSERERAVPQPA